MVVEQQQLMENKLVDNINTNLTQSKPQNSTAICSHKLIN